MWSVSHNIGTSKCLDVVHILISLIEDARGFQPNLTPRYILDGFLRVPDQALENLPPQR